MIVITLDNRFFAPRANNRKSDSLNRFLAHGVIFPPSIRRPECDRDGRRLSRLPVVDGVDSPGAKSAGNYASRRERDGVEVSGVRPVRESRLRHIRGLGAAPDSESYGAHGRPSPAAPGLAEVLGGARDVRVVRSFHASREAFVAVKGDFQRRLHFPTELLGYLDTTFLVCYGFGLLFSGSIGARYGNKTMAIVGLAGTALVIATMALLSMGWITDLPTDKSRRGPKACSCTSRCGR